MNNFAVDHFEPRGNVITSAFNAQITKAKELFHTRIEQDIARIPLGNCVSIDGQTTSRFTEDTNISVTREGEQVWLGRSWQVVIAISQEESGPPTYSYTLKVNDSNDPETYSRTRPNLTIRDLGRFAFNIRRAANELEGQPSTLDD